MMILLYIFVFVFGTVFGSFLNVCILRIPQKETIVTERSHCMSCGHQLEWYDLFPLFSYIFLKGKCRYCGEKISAQYPIIEGLNGLLWCLTFVIIGWKWEAVFICAAISALMVVAVIDWRTFEIPFGVVVFIAVLGVLHLAYVFITVKFGIGTVDKVTSMDFVDEATGIGYTIESVKKGYVTGIAAGAWYEYIIGFFAISVPLLLIYIISKGKGIGGGDIKLMAAAGLLVGWKFALLALILGCFFGSVIHIARMKLSGEGRVLAMGPYLAAGLTLAMWFGQPILAWYEGLYAG
ncbi:MAG: prepilin peptidase [Lachnospiraceae bacterium]|nr:prepilin peptidase [Lachnospiraceae bacterium]